MAKIHNDDEFTLFMLAAGSIGTILAVLATTATIAWHTTLAWLLDHGILVTAAHSPWITIPRANGAGLDAERCFVAAAALLLLGFLLFEAARRRLARNRELA